MSLINDMLHDKQRRNQETKPLGTDHDEHDAPQKRTPPDSDSHVHGKFDDIAMYNPYSSGEDSGTYSDLGLKDAPAARTLLMVGTGLGLAAFIHFAILPSKSFIGQMVDNDPFYASGAMIWAKAHSLFQPSVPPVLQEMTEVTPVRSIMPRKARVPSVAPPENYAINAVAEEASRASALLAAGFGKMLAYEPLTVAIPTNTPEADVLRQIAALNAPEEAPQSASSQSLIQKGGTTTRAKAREIQSALMEAENYVRIGASERATALLVNSLKQNPEASQVRVALAGLQLDLGQYDEAERIIEVGQKLNPMDTDIRRLKAQWHADQGQVQKGIETLLVSPPHMAEAPEYYSVLAALYEKDGQHRLAASVYNDLVQLHPDSARWWTGLGISLEASDAFQLAMNSYMKALSLGTLEPQLRAFVSKRLKQLGNRDSLVVDDSVAMNTAR